MVLFQIKKTQTNLSCERRPNLPTCEQEVTQIFCGVSSTVLVEIFKPPAEARAEISSLGNSLNL